MPEAVDREFLDPDVLGRLAAVPLFARSPMQGNVSGRHQSPHRGSSVEFAEYRKYVPGDDTRRLDWRAYGRSDRFYIKEFEADTNLRCCLVLDTSASMGFGSDSLRKIDYARKLAAALAYLAVHQGDAVGLSTVANGLVQYLPPRRNPAHLRLIYNALGEAEPQGETGLVEVLHELAERIQQRALVAVFSDLFADPDALSECFQHLRFRKHDAAIFHLLDRQEIDFHFDRPLRFVSLENDEVIIAEPSLIADRYQHALQEYLEIIREGCIKSNADYHPVVTDQPYEDVLATFLAKRVPKQARR